jgi:hypothetical protein
VEKMTEFCVGKNQPLWEKNQAPWEKAGAYRATAYRAT